MKEMIKIFNSEKIRIIIIGNEPYFNAQDVCRNLDIKNTGQALYDLEKDDIILNDTIDSMNRVVKVNFVSESGLYDLLMKSRKKEAKQFKKWITHEVLPSIRKTGKYSIPDEVKKISTKNRNVLTSEWKNHGIIKPHEYIQLTLQEYKSLKIENKKAEMTKHEILLLSALESMESLNLFENQNINGYYDCKDSLIETSEKIKKISKRQSLNKIKGVR